VGTQRFVAHELAHVMTFRAMNKSNTMAKLNSLGAMPTWFLEGIAQYEAEYWYPSLDRMLRLATLENSLLTTTERTNFRMLGMHAGAAGYNEGYSLCRYMFDTHGRDKVAVLMANLRDGKKTFEQAIEATFGKTLVAIDAGWRQHLRDGYAKQIKGLQDKVPGATSIVDTYQGEVNVQPKLSPDGKRLAYLTSRHQDSFLYLRGNVMGFLSLFVGEPDGKGARMVPVGRGAVTSYDWSSDGSKIVYSRVVQDAVGNPGFDVFTYDVKARTTTRLTENEGANAMAWRPGTRQVAYVSVKDGLAAVKLIDTRTKKVSTIHKPKGDEQYREPAWSPDGRQLAVIAHAPGGTGRLMILDVETGKLRPVAKAARGGDSAPAWTPDGRTIVFSSDRSGMTNLYAIEVASGAERQLTNTFRGAETPSVAPDGSAILYATYKAKGSMIHRIPFALGKSAGGGGAAGAAKPKPAAKVVEPDQGREPLNAARAPKGGGGITLETVQGFSVGPEMPPTPALPAGEGGALDQALDEAFSIKGAKPYRSTLTNDLLIPQMTSDEKGQQIGVATVYSDILDKHQLGVDVRYGIMSQRFSYMAQYVNRMAASSWSVSLFDSPQVALAPDVGLNGRPVVESLYFQRMRGASLGVMTPLGGGRTLSTGAQMGTLSTLAAPYAGNYGQLREGQLNSLSAVFHEQHVKNTVDADINPSDGYRMALGWTMSDHSIGSNFDYTQYLFQGERYFAINPDLRHNLTWRWNLGLINGDAPQPFLLGGANGSAPIFALRGYAVGAFSGTRLATTGVEYTLPILTHMDRMVGPLYLDRLYVAAFSDVGSAWAAGGQSNPFASVGGEIRLRTSVMGRQLLTFRIGLAQKLGSSDFPGFYITF
jgi:Tol biopolymer transport system component